MISLPPDPLLADLAEYVVRPVSPGAWAHETARHCLMDSLGCACLALQYPACTRLLGPVVPGAEMANGVPVPGTGYRLDPVTAAFNVGAMIRWLDYNDTWLAREWGHPSDNLGAILACADYQSRRQKQPMVVGDVLQAMIKAYEIQGVLSLTHAFNRVGLDHVLLVRIASTALAAFLLGGSRQDVLRALSQAWIDGGALRTYRHAPNTGSRKSWAAGDATSRGVRLALLTLAGETGYPTALTAPKWGFQDTLFQSQPITLSQPLGCYVMENILFKISFPAEFHAQTAVEAGLQLHPLVRDRLDQIQRVQIRTQEPALRIIDKTGPLTSPADRDHCLQYMVAVALVFGQLTADHYEDQTAADPRLDHLRSLMEVSENNRYTADYLAPDKRSIANSVRVFFKDGTSTREIEVEYPVGHRRRREEGFPLLREKFEKNLALSYKGESLQGILDLWNDPDRLEVLAVPEFMDLLAAPAS